MTIEEIDNMMRSKKPFLVGSTDYPYFRLGICFTDQEVLVSDEFYLDRFVPLDTSVQEMLITLQNEFVLLDYFEDDQVKKGNRCICPKENFTVSGVGCKCGGV